ncbi:beta-N-acetylhexosaminidase [Parendozoicomonas haliclonae]|uniref:beta-N-acetylhexosaminidase n=1 Tax=Parendozoicomonas haliclonae TaxID=1960125 RepID=A0A1X7AKE6_9GAMM|nr:beta-N-acetylhexosaminidase [Parendozoicomonas haliclonae]SMA47336.1 Beta-hexosaminidase [Parendozoicomonas haliclonae]
MSLRARINNFLIKDRHSSPASFIKGETHNHNLLPVPNSMEQSEGEFILPYNSHYTIHGPYRRERLEQAVQRFTDVLDKSSRTESAYDFQQTNASQSSNLSIQVEQYTDFYPSVDDDESYNLIIDEQGIQITATTDWGALRALTSLNQLIVQKGDHCVLPCVTIKDQPVLKWRGLLLDISRHFMPHKLVLQLLDTMAMVKLNVLHLHLTDDQGFRVESKRYPRLQSVDTRQEYYTQQQVRTLVDYAADRGIRVVPEVNLPGHCAIIQLAYPELSLKNFQPKTPNDFLGDFSPPLDITKADTYTFIENLTAEITALFPDRYYHLGGDEVPEQPWLTDPSTRIYMKELGFKTGCDLQAEFTRQYAEIVQSYGKTPIVWEEAINDRLPEGVIIQPWEKGHYRVDTTKHPIINNWRYYLDFKRPAWSYYRQSPFALEVNKRQVSPKDLLGAELSVWTESTLPETLMRTVWPQGMAIAELFWSGPSLTSRTAIADLYRRMDHNHHLMENCGLLSRQALHKDLSKLAGNNSAPLEKLADVIEPAGYHFLRQRYKIPSLLLPRLFPRSFHESDGRLFLEQLPPESRTGYLFKRNIERYLNGEKELFISLQQDLQQWRDNHNLLSDTLPNTLTGQSDDIVQLSAKLSQLAEAGLQLLLACHQQECLPETVLKPFKRLLDQCEYDTFELGQHQEVYSLLLGFLKPDTLNRHNIAIQPGIRQLFNACKQQISVMNKRQVFSRHKRRHDSDMTLSP